MEKSLRARIGLKTERAALARLQATFERQASDLEGVKAALASQQSELALFEAVLNLTPGAHGPTFDSNPPAHRRKWLRSIFSAVLAGGVVGQWLASSTPAQARLISGGQVGAIIVPVGVNPAGQLPASSYGVVASSEPGFSLSSVSANNIGVYGNGNGVGEIGRASCRERV